MSSIVLNESIRDLNNIPSFFSSRNTHSATDEKNIYRPLRTFIRSLEYSIWKLDPIGYHVVNVIFHIGTTLFFYGALLILSGAAYFSALSAFLFALMPVHTESVTYISGADDNMAGFFFMAGIFAYTRRRSIGEEKKWLGLPVPLLFILALASKEMAITFPMVIILLDYFFFRKKNSLSSRFKCVYLPLFAITAIYILVRMLVAGPMVQLNYEDFGGAHSLFSSLSVGGIRYLQLLFFPINLCVDYRDFPLYDSFFRPKPLFSVIVIFFLLFFMGKWRRTFPFASFGLAFYFVTLLPVSQIFPLKILIAERFLYIPSVGFSIFAGAIIINLFKSINTSSFRRISILSIILILLMNGILVIDRNKVWRSDFNLWKDTLVKYPENARGHYNLGIAYLNRKEYAKALMEYRKGMSLGAPRAMEIYNLGVIYAKMGQYERALKYFQETYQPNPYARRLTEDNIKKLKKLLKRSNSHYGF